MKKKVRKPASPKARKKATTADDNRPRSAVDGQYSFFENVWEVVKLIPKGRVSSYGAIARYLGTAKSARTVGYAMNACAAHRDVPAHRVLNRIGMLTGRHHFNPPEAMQQRLEKEGVKVKQDTVQNFDKVFWDPNTELA